MRDDDCLADDLLAMRVIDKRLYLVILQRQSTSCHAGRVGGRKKEGVGVDPVQSAPASSTAETEIANA